MNQLPKILIVDDHPHNRLALRTVLKGVPAELHEAGNGFDALTLALDGEFALILLDVQMPEMDGYEVCEQLRSDPKTADTPVIFLTAAYKEDVDKARGYVAGATDYLTKPLDDHILKAKVEIFLRLYTQKRLLQDSEFRWKFAIEGTGDGLWDWNVADNTVFFSKRWKEMLGHTEDEVGSGLEEWENRIHPDDKADTLATVQAYLDGKTTVYQSEHRIQCKKGDYKWILDRGTVVSRDKEGKPLRLIGTHTDITARKQAEAELLRSNTELEQFAYAVSHDLRQPLRMVNSYMEMLERCLADTLNDDTRGMMHFAVDGATRMDQMLVSLLEYSRIGRKGEPPAWVESRTVLDEALLFLQPAMVEANAVVCIQGDWPRVLVSPDEILRLLQNLIGNAVKFRVAGRIPQVTVNSEMVEKAWRVSVSDNGIGILPDQIERLFKVFQRLQPRTAYQGTGIGLALCRKIVEHHKGRLWVESEGKGLGSCFTFLL